MTTADTPSSSGTPPGAAPQRRVDQLLARCGESHTPPTNEVIHFVAIPLIMLSLVGLIYALPSSWWRGFSSSSGIKWKVKSRRSLKTSSTCGWAPFSC